MTDLIKVNYESEQPLVSGRELHEFLEIKTPYTQWFDHMVKYGFAENVDFAVFHKIVKDDTAFGGQRKSIDHALNLDMAKEIAMLQRTEKGKQARQYFIAIEKAWNDPVKVVQRAFKVLTTENASQKQLIDKLQNDLKAKPLKYILAERRKLMLETHNLLTSDYISQVLDITTLKLGRLANKHNLKTEEYGLWYNYNNCTTSITKINNSDCFAYYDNVIPELQEILQDEVLDELVLDGFLEYIS